LFDRWASTYDETVYGGNGEYVEVFAGYDQILQSVAERTSGTVLEFGVGTGNLTAKLVALGRRVLGVEPSLEMRKLARHRFADVPIYDGDFLHFQVPVQQVDSIVSTYAFHHLTDEEKQVAGRRFNALLPTGGKVIFADTVFVDEDAKQNAISRAKLEGRPNLAQDLATEYYTTVPEMTRIFEEAGFAVEFAQCNAYVWRWEATKMRPVEAEDVPAVQ
jgi:putative AdoMet-dependent methyltransferase